MFPHVFQPLPHGTFHAAASGGRVLSLVAVAAVAAVVGTVAICDGLALPHHRESGIFFPHFSTPHHHWTTVFSHRRQHGGTPFTTLTTFNQTDFGRFRRHRPAGH